jgi:hypothetical protein
MTKSEPSQNRPEVAITTTIDVRFGSKADIATDQLNVRFGSKADIAARPRHVRFTPESGHRNSVAQCPLRAKSRHSAVQQGSALFDNLVHAGKQTRRHRKTEQFGRS